tara:strand:- start:88 stop:801 length:714 start_codon:yes stop_codon:yes gene_type:complete
MFFQKNNYSEEDYNEISIQLIQKFSKIKNLLKKTEYFEWVSFSNIDDNYEYKYGGVKLVTKSLFKKKLIGNIYITSNMNRTIDDSTFDIYINKTGHSPIKIDSIKILNELNSDFFELTEKFKYTLEEFIALDEAGLLYRKFPENYIGESNIKIIRIELSKLIKKLLINFFLFVGSILVPFGLIFLLFWIFMFSFKFNNITLSLIAFSFIFVLILYFSLRIFRKKNIKKRIYNYFNID